MSDSFTRRQFLRESGRGLLAAHASWWALGRAGAQPVAPSNRVYDCVVLGAGIAGLTAARDLQAAGWSVLVLEGNNRIGGRIYTTTDSNLGPVELGAEFIHRPPGSVPLWREVQRYQLPSQTIPKMSEGRIYEPNFLDLPLRGRLRRPAVAALRSGPIRTPLMMTKLENYDGPDQTPRQWIERNYGNRPMQADFSAMMLTGHLPGTLDDLSVRGFRADGVGSQLMERGEYYLTRGYHSLVASTAQGLAIETGHTVEKVVSGAEGVTIHARNGQSAREFKARAVLCTFSIGMLRNLQQADPDFFSPRLPAPTAAALSRLEGGHHSKIVLVFNQCFWPERLAMLHNPSHTRRAGRTYFRPFYPDASRPVLTAYLLAEDAIRLDAMSQDDAVRLVCEDLGEIFGLDALSRLRYSYRWRWKLDDAFAHGGFSYLSVNGDPSMPVENARATLANASHTAPLFLAGEATAVETQPASVHGAHASGLRAALQIAQYLRYGRVPSLAETTAAIHC